ncbi:cadherin-like and PC-esterase domain-containing protein 1 [Caerostris extrusa]|uniref:Cadherin-like and PC-esterase domain-containing protein 1 n=1 Tax=Caerostris extrusa TaxID=172846 RepID=A0AAV4PCQ1_CAEEX|nr:cadherin-like and PC-esterase domain-containing protein 1 [Caerostris extrusa]
MQYQEFVNVAEALGYASQWLLKPLTAVSGPRLVDIFSPVGQAEIDEFSRRRAVAQQMVSTPFAVFGQPVSIRLYVLVTSLLPLRAYVHSQGVVYHRYNESKNFKKVRLLTSVSKIIVCMCTRYETMAVILFALIICLVLSHA